MKNLLSSAGAAVLAVLAGCCQNLPPPPQEAVPEAITVHRTGQKITVDGRLNESAWQQAKVHRLVRSNNWKGLPPKIREKVKKEPFQGGSFRLLMDDKYLYLAVEFEDSDVLAGSIKNQSRLYRTGDLAELFLTPEGGHAYFEIYVNPAGAHTFYAFPGGGTANLLMMFDEDRKTPGIKAAAQVNGTLNDQSDVDRSWSAELAVPLKSLAGFGTEFAPGNKWCILVSRYNYAAHLRKLQFSGLPELPPGVSFGDIEYHAPLEFVVAE